jgi:hypothetical protein
LENPYIVERPLTERDLFFGREEFFDLLTAALHRGRRIILLYGRRRIGKTSFLNQLPARYSARYQVHLAALDTAAEGSPDLLWDALGAIARATGYPIPDLETYKRDPTATAHAYLRELTRAEDTTRHLVCLDALPEGSLAPQGPGRALLASLRQALPETSAWAFLIAIQGAPPQATEEDDDLAALPRIVLGPLTEDETHDALTTPVRNVLAYDYEAVNHIHRLCGGQPYFVQLFGHILFERRAAMGWVGLPEVEQAAANVVEQATPQFQALWQACSPLERVVLCALAEMPGHHGLGSAQDVLLYLHQRQVEVPLPAIEAALQALVGRDILEQLGGPILRFRVALWSAWLKRYQSLAQALRQAKLRRRATAQPMAPPEGRQRDWVGLLLWLVAAALVVSIATVWRSRERGIIWTAAPTATPQTTQLAPAVTLSPTSLTGANAGVAPGFIVYCAKERAEDTWEIYVMRSDGSDPIRLTHNEANDMLPRWSPDGRRIVFVSDRDGNREIYVMNADGNEQLNLTRHPAEDWTPCWSPDGQRIAFASFRDGNWEIYVMNADGTNPQRLTRNNAADYSPAWSPDGQRIAFVSNRDGNLEIYIMNADGSNPTRFTQHEATDQNPAWSPDGLWLYWESARDGNMEIYRARLDGAELTNLTRDPQANHHGPTCSPRGDKIAFFSNRDQGWDIYTLDLATGVKTNLTLSTTLEQMPHWGAAGRP